MTFTTTLLSWYDENKRDLPWRRTHDPYIIWVSEIILQQTRVEQGLEYFTRFIRRFPSIWHLARSSENDVLNVWQGLGYYSRARNMHSTAIELISRYQGIFPDNFPELNNLKGIGPYTAAAIASLAFDLPYPVVDGNVLRFFSRFFGITDPVDRNPGKRKIQDLARNYMDINDPGKYNQAIMEFGSKQCKPGNPDCPECPFHQDCYAWNHAKVTELPLKSKVQNQKDRFFHYFVLLKEGLDDEKFIVLSKRESNDIWKNLYDFPLIETKKAISAEKLMSSESRKKMFPGKEVKISHRSDVYKHILTHQVIYARFYFIKNVEEIPNASIMVSLKDIHSYPVPRLIDKFLNEMSPD